jgi:AbrB family looped-hinge helix DNA binding protein
MYLAKIKKKSQVTVPAEIMKEAELRCGDLVEFILELDQIVLRPKKLVNAQRGLNRE